jgi:hypothetical protein
MLALLAGCATQNEVTSYYDNFSGRTDLMSGNVLEAPGQPREVIWLNASRIFKGANRAVYYLEATYVATEEVGWLDVGPGQSLTLAVDGQALKFTSASGSLNMRKPFKKEGTRFVRETVIYEATADQLRKIAGAKEVKVQFKGANGLVERAFAAENFERFRTFVSRFAS